jgi:uncharacterized membrane protein YjfL (UPF0719 family)
MMWLLAMAETIPSAEPVSYWSYLWHGVVGSLVFGILGILLLLGGYWLFELVTPHLDVQKELREKNLAVAIVVAALLLGIAYVAAHVVTG